MDLYRLAQGARWPRPFAVVPVALLVAIGCAVWRPLLLVFAAIWAVMAGLAVLDARARGRHGLRHRRAVGRGSGRSWSR